MFGYLYVKLSEVLDINSCLITGAKFFTRNRFKLIYLVLQYKYDEKIYFIFKLI